MSAVWKSANVSGSHLLVLLALADFATDEGLAWPAIKTLAEKARISERQTQEVLRSLEEQGYLSIGMNEGPHRTNVYRVQIEGADSAPRSQQQGAPGCTGGVQSTAPLRVKPTAPNPLLEPSPEPSVSASASARARAGTAFKAYEQVIGPITQPVAVKLQEAEDEHHAVCIERAFAQAAEHNKRSWAYVAAILRGCEGAGCTERQCFGGARAANGRAPAAVGDPYAADREIVRRRDAGKRAAAGT